MTKHKPKTLPSPKLGPGEYVPDPTEGLTRVEDLPQAKIIKASRTFRHQPCPRCGRSAYRDRVFRRTLHDLGDLASGRPHDLQLTYSQHYCVHCQTYFNADTSDLAAKGSHYTRRVVDLAIRLVNEDGMPYRSASWKLWRDHRVFVPFATLQNWVEAGEKKGHQATGRRASGLGTGRLQRLSGRR